MDVFVGKNKNDTIPRGTIYRGRRERNIVEMVEGCSKPRPMGKLPKIDPLGASIV